MRLEQLEEFAKIYLQNDSLVYLLPNVVPGSPGTAQKPRTKFEMAREKAQRKAMCAELGIRTHSGLLQHKIREFQTSLYEELCQRVRLRVMRGGAAADALHDAPSSVRRAALSLHLLSAALKNETKRLSREGAASAIVNILCAAWEAAGRCEGCGGRTVGGAGGAGGEGGCEECRGGGAPPTRVLRAVGRQFEVEDLDALRKLWLQYREVALQKLRALTKAGDDLRHVPAAARPTATDWRVIDLTLLHDHNYKLLTDMSVKHYEQLQPLIVLFSLVQQFGLERGEESAWRDAHRHARDRGSCVSLVLLQRRWHSLCVAARAGVLAAMRAPGAPALPPLHAALVRRFPEVATRPLMSWRELVAAGRVYTDFQKAPDEESSAAPRGPAPVDTDQEDDLILVEKDIETIELRESDGEADELIIDEDDKSLVALAQDTQNLQQTIREEIQNHRELLRNTEENSLEPNPVEQSNVTVSAMDIDNVEGASVSNAQNYTNVLVCNENIVYLYVDNNQALNNGNTVLENVASGDVGSNEAPSTSSLNSLDTGQSLSILNKINPESSEAMIIFEDDDSDEMSPSGDNNSGDERSDNDRCNNAEGDSVQAEDISVNSLNKDDTKKKEAVTESQDTKDNISKQIVRSDNINNSFKENHNLSTDEIKSKDDNTNKEVTTPIQDTEDSGNQIVESKDLANQTSSDINSVNQCNDAKHDFDTEDIPTESKNHVENANKETAMESEDTECTRNQISESNEVIESTNDKKGVDGSIVTNDLRNEDNETQNKVSENTPNENKNIETATKSQETENSSNQIVKSNVEESNQNFEAIDKNEMVCKNELQLEIDDNLEIRNSEASSVGDQLEIDIIRENLGKDMSTASENIPKIDNVFSIASVETKSENEVSNDSTSHSNETANDVMMDTNVVETSTNNGTDAVESNSDETDNASNMDTTDVTPGAIDPKLLMTARIPLTRVDSSPLPPPSLLVEDFSSHPDYNARRLGISDGCLLKNRHLLRMCRPVSVHVGRLSSALLDRYLGPGRPARRVLLPDIEDVRRANRRLATAQVAPTPLPTPQDSEDSGDATEQPSPPVDEVQEEMPMPTEEELMNLLQRCEPPQGVQRGGAGNGRKYCCAARRHRAFNDARARLAARAGKRQPDQQDIHGATHRFTQCKCCCLHLLPGAADAALLARLARRRRRLERQAITLLHRTTEQGDEGDNSDSDGDDGEDLDVAVTNQATKKKWKKKKVPENTEQPSSNDDYLEWIRQKTLANKYFHIQAIGDETHKAKPTHTDTAHKHTETTNVQKQPVSKTAQTQTHNKYVPRVFGNKQSKDDSSAVTETKAVESSCKMVTYSEKRTGKTVVKMCRPTGDAASGGNRKRKSLEDVADTPNKITIRISPESENISIDGDSIIVSQIMKDGAEKQNAQSTSQNVGASGSREDSLKTLDAAKHTGLVDNNKKAADLFHVSDSDDDDFVDRLFIDETAQKSDRTVSQNLNFDNVKHGNEIKDKSTEKQAYTDVEKGTEPLTVDASEDVLRTNDTLNEASQTKTKPNEDAETGTLSDKSDETLELKLLPSKKVYQKVVRPKLASPNTSGSNQSAVITATCDKTDDAKNSVALTTENVNKHLSTESLKVSLTNVKVTASDVSETRAGDESDDDVQFVEATPVKAKIDPRSLLKTQVRVTPPTRPPTILEQIALMHEKGQKFIIQKVVDQETSPVYKSEPKVNRISRYIGLVPEKPKIGPAHVKVVPGQPAAGPVVNLNEQLATMCSPSTTQPHNALAKPIVNTTTSPVITIKQLPPLVPIAPKLPKLVSVTKSSQNIYSMTVSKVSADANKSKYSKATITMETTKVPESAANKKSATNHNQPMRIGNAMPVTKVTADANKPTKVAQYHKAVITMETRKLPVSAAQLKAKANCNQPMRIGNTTIMRTPKVNESNIAIKVTPPKPEIKECIPVLTLDGTKSSEDSNVTELNTNQVLSSNIEAEDPVPLLTLDASTIPADNSINASGLVLKVSQDGLVMTTKDDMATITAVARDDDVDDVGSIDNDDGDGAKDDGDGTLPVISNVKSLAEPVLTIHSKILNTWSSINDSEAASRAAEPLTVSAREFVRGRDPTDITVLCVDAARALLHLRGHHLLVTELEIPMQRAQYWPPTGDRPLAFDTTESACDASPARAPSGGGLKVRSFARLPPPPAAAPDRVRSDGKVYKKMCDDPLVYAKVVFVCPTLAWCRRALAAPAWAGLRAPRGDLHPVLRAPPGPTSAGLKCDRALPALLDLVSRLNQLKTRQAAAVTYHTQKKPRAPASSDVITVDSDDEAPDSKMAASDDIDDGDGSNVTLAAVPNKVHSK